MAVGPIQPPIQWVPRFIFRVRRLEREVDHSPPCIAEQKRECSCTFVILVCFDGGTGTNLPFILFVRLLSHSGKVCYSQYQEGGFVKIVCPETRCASTVQIVRPLLCREMTFVCLYVCYKNRVEHTGTLCGQCTDFLVLNLEVYSVSH